jgi:oligoendopeptidase F
MKHSVELFMPAEETTFGRSLYTEGNGHPPLDRNNIDTIYRKSIAPYEYWSIKEVGASREWMRKPLLFNDPLYLVNYLYAAVVAVALYDRAHTDPNVASKYEALLSSGFDAQAQAILARMGIWSKRQPFSYRRRPTNYSSFTRLKGNRPGKGPGGADPAYVSVL